MNRHLQSLGITHYRQDQGKKICGWNDAPINQLMRIENLLIMHSAANFSDRRKKGSSAAVVAAATLSFFERLRLRSRRTTIWSLFALPVLLLLAAVLMMVTREMMILVVPVPPPPNKTLLLKSLNSSARISKHNQTASFPSNSQKLGGPYHNWELFADDYEEMQQNFKIFVYPDIYNASSPFANIYLPHPNSFTSIPNSKIGNYFSEHAFKAALLQSSLITPRPELAHMFFMPFSINAMRNDRRLRSEASISDFVAQYAVRISSEFDFWNTSGGADHFYACCHSVGREATSKHRGLYNNAIQVTCSSSYFQRFFVAHKDIGLPQVWPRPGLQVLNPPHARTKLVFFAGRMQNSPIRQELLALWGNDTSMDIFSGKTPFSYEEGFRQSKYCLHVKGYEVNTARVSDAIHYGCIPVLISNYYDLPFANVLDWSKFSIIINQADIVHLKNILLSVPSEMYESMYQNLQAVRRHFTWNSTPRSYDSFYMTAYQLWLRRGLQRVAY